MEEKQEEFANYVELQFLQLMNTDGIILDVRNNGGGTSLIEKKIISHLISEDFTSQQVSYRLSKAVMVERPYISQLIPDIMADGLFSEWLPKIIEPAEDGPIYRKKIILLIDSGCFSACDTFVDALASNGLALAVGQGTGGGTGNPLNFEVPSSTAMVRFSTWRGLSNSGKYLEGSGTIPNVEAWLSSHDIASGIDSVLIKAYDMLLNEKTDTSAVKTMSLAVSGVSNNSFKLKDENILPASVIEDREINLSNHECPIELMTGH